MTNNRIITYAVDREEGWIISRVGPEIAHPVYQFADFGTDGDFTGEIPVELDRFSIYDLQPWGRYRWTKKIPVEVKNLHRAYWGFPLLRLRAASLLKS